MARFELELPEEVMKQVQQIEDNADDIFGGMTKAGAEVVMGNIVANVPASIRKSAMMGNLKITRTYKTPSDDGINTKVAFYGYFKSEDGVERPAPLVANVFEHGRSTSKFPKQPFMRRSFNKGQIEQAMKAAQRSLSGGVLDE